MGAISIVKLYDLLTLKVGKETAEHLTTYIEDKLRQEFEKRSGILATKDDLLLTKDALTKEISRLDIKISENKSEIIKWMFAFWIAQAATTFGLILLFLKK